MHRHDYFNLSIPELIKIVKHSFRECEFDDVQNILMDRDKKMKIEIEDLKRDLDSMMYCEDEKKIEIEELKRDLDSIKKEARLLERSQSLVELEKLRLEEKFQRSERKCEELNETITRLIEEQRVSCDRAKRAEDRYEKVSQENSKMTIEKNKFIFELNGKINELKNNNLKSEQLVGEYKDKLNKMTTEKNKFIFELNGKINELKNKNLENEQLVGEYKHKFKSLDARVVVLGQEIKDLRHEILTSNQIIKELRRKEFEANQVVEELKRENLEATQTLDELRQEKMESDSRLEILAPRVTKMEAELANMLNVKVENLANLADIMGKSVAAATGENVDLPDIFNGRKDSLEIDNTNADAENVVITSLGLRYTSNPTRSRDVALSKKGGRNLVHSRTKEDGADTVQTSGSQSGCNPYRVESDDTVPDNEDEKPLFSGSLASFTRSGGEARCSSKIACSSSAARDVIEICDSDDETKPGDTTYISDTSSGPTSKRNRTGFMRGFSPESDYKEERKHLQKRRA